MYGLLMIFAFFQSLLPIPVTIEGNVNEECNLEGKLIYLITKQGIQYDLIDSCCVEDGKFSFAFPMKEEMKCQLSIEMKPSFLNFIGTPGDSLKIEIYQDKSPRLRVQGSLSTEETAKYNREYDSIRVCRLLPLVDSLKKISKSEIDKFKSLSESINFIEDSILFHDLPLSYLTKTKSPVNYISFLSEMTCSKELDKEVLDTYGKEFRRRFPESTLWTEFYETKSTKLSERSKEIIRRQYGSDYFKPKPKPETVPDSIAALPAYAVGDTIYDFTLPGLDANVTLSQAIDAPYTLIDFWASWCMPCRKEIPQLLKIDRMFDSMSVVAVSLDKKPEEWKKAIQQDGSARFTHLWIEPGNPQGQALKVRCSVTYIPTNFLIDRNRRIIARDLHGKQLVDMMNKLSEETDSNP